MDAIATAAPFRDPLRRPALACGLLVAVSIAIAALGKPTAAPGPDRVAASVALRFEDGDNGLVIAREAGAGAEIARFTAGEGGFVRVAMRGLASERRKRGIPSAEPFLLTKLDNGELVLRDPATGRRVLLDAFGQTNAASFGALLGKGGREG